MKKVIKQLQKQIAALEAVIQKRYDHVEGKSEGWLWSKKGKEYKDKTSDIETQMYSIGDSIQKLKELL